MNKQSDMLYESHGSFRTERERPPTEVVGFRGDGVPRLEIVSSGCDCCPDVVRWRLVDMANVR
jgi:hypothetical protein